MNTKHHNIPQKSAHPLTKVNIYQHFRLLKHTKTTFFLNNTTFYLPPLIVIQMDKEYILRNGLSQGCHCLVVLWDYLDT